MSERDERPSLAVGAGAPIDPDPVTGGPAADGGPVAKASADPDPVTGGPAVEGGPVAVGDGELVPPDDWVDPPDAGQQRPPSWPSLSSSGDVVRAVAEFVDDLVEDVDADPTHTEPDDHPGQNLRSDDPPTPC